MGRFENIAMVYNHQKVGGEGSQQISSSIFNIFFKTRAAGFVVALACGVLIYFFMPPGMRKLIRNSRPKKVAKDSAQRIKSLHKRKDYEHVPDCSPSPRSEYNLFREYNCDATCLHPTRSIDDYRSDYSSPPELGLKVSSHTNLISPGKNETKGPFFISPIPSKRKSPKYVVKGENGALFVSSPSSEDRNNFSVPIEEEMRKQLLVLISKRCLNKTKACEQTQALDLLKKRNISHIIVDAGDPLQRKRRNELYGISGLRAVFPQFFFVHSDGGTTYFGDWKLLKRIHQTEGLPKSFLKSHPEIPRWDDVFQDTSVIFHV